MSGKRRPKDMPVLLVTKVGRVWNEGNHLAREVMAWCPFCVKYHTHGQQRYPEQKSWYDPGSRVAHCGPKYIDGKMNIQVQSPYEKKGYWLKLDDSVR